MKGYTIIYFSLLCVLLVSCNRGCTSYVTIDSETSIHSLSGEKVEVVVELVDRRNTRRVNRKRKTTHDYSIEFNVKYKGEEFDNIYSEDDKREDEDLIAELNRVSVLLSSDVKHLAVGVDDSLLNLWHFYKNKPIPMNSYLEAQFYYGASMSDVDINGFPPIEEMIIDNFKEGCKHGSGEDAVGLTDFFDSYSASDTIHRTILDQWPNCRFAQSYLASESLETLRKNRVWRKYLTERGEKLFDIGILDECLMNTQVVLEGAQDHDLIARFDAYLYDRWRYAPSKYDRFDFSESVEMRLRSVENPISLKIKSDYVSKAKEEFNAFRMHRDEEDNFPPANCFRILLTAKDTLTSYQFITKDIAQNFRKYQILDIKHVVLDNYALFTPFQQNALKEIILTEFDQLDRFDKGKVFDGSKSIFDCKQLDKWKKTYPNDLNFAYLPQECP